MGRRRGKRNNSYYTTYVPEPAMVPPPAPAPGPRIVPFWEKAASDSKEPEGSEEKKPGNAGPDPSEDKGQPASPTTSAGQAEDPPFPPVMSPTTTWEEAGQYALNASILSGRFEDLRILAFSEHVSPNRVGAPRPLYANTTLLTRALPGILKDGRFDEVPEADLALREDLVVSDAYYGYGEDSDLEDDLEDESEEARKTAESVPGSREDEGDVEDADNPSDDLGARIPPQTHSTSKATGTSEDDVLAHLCTTSNSTVDSTKPEAPAPAGNVFADQNTCAHAQDTTQQEPTPQGRSKSNGQPYSRAASDGLRTIVVTDTAYRTLRAAVFYAYTRRIAFAPLRSQGLPFAPGDDEDDPSVLPICSPKSIYRLAEKYGNAELEQLAGNDIASKLSTQNVLTELFSRFTSRYPPIQDMELNFVLTYIKHPDITVRLPAWVDRFAGGELKDCADTFGRLIHKLACAATVSPSGVNVCPRGCPMPTLQHRCGTCGVTFN